MQAVFFEYELTPTTWACLSSLMTIGIYFKFRRFWSVRNLDIVALVSMVPGLLLVIRGGGGEQVGYTWLFVASGFFMVRLLLDPIMVRRPLLEPNLSTDGLTFAAVALLVFLIANVATAPLTVSDLEGARRIDQLLDWEGRAPGEMSKVTKRPGHPLFSIFARFSNKMPLVTPDETDPQRYRRAEIRRAITRIIAIFGHLAVVVGIVLIGVRHFDNVQTGISAATLYLLYPYTAEMTEHVDHVVPAALLIWAVQTYRRPIVSGALIGLAIGLVYYPLFLLPLWCSFYWRRGLLRFSLGVVISISILVASLALTAGDLEMLFVQLQQMFGWGSISLEGVTGFWQYYEPAYRVPVIAAFLALCSSMALWPAQKNLGTLLSCSAAVMLGTQFWVYEEGGTYMAWYLPLLIVTIFRPNLEDRVALATVL